MLKNATVVNGVSMEWSGDGKNVNFIMDFSKNVVIFPSGLVEGVPFELICELAENLRSTGNDHTVNIGKTTVAKQTAVLTKGVGVNSIFNSLAEAMREEPPSQEEVATVQQMELSTVEQPEANEFDEDLDLPVMPGSAVANPRVKTAQVIESPVETPKAESKTAPTVRRLAR